MFKEDADRLKQEILVAVSAAVSKFTKSTGVAPSYVLINMVDVGSRGESAFVVASVDVEVKL